MLQIRKTKKADLAPLAKIYKRAYDRPKEGESWSLKNAKALLNFYANQKTFIGLTARFDGKIVGAFFSFIKPWYDGKHLGEGELFVEPAWQKKGIGTKLFYELILSAKKRGCIIHELVAYDKVSHWYKKIGMNDSGLTHMTGEIDGIIKKMR